MTASPDAAATAPTPGSGEADVILAPQFPRGGLGGEEGSSLDAEAISSLQRLGSKETIAFDLDTSGRPGSGAVDWAGLLAELPARASILATGDVPRAEEPGVAGRAGAGGGRAADSTDQFATSDLIQVTPTASGERPSGVTPPDFVLRECLGAGGMGEVWRAWQTSLAREVAVKTLKAGDLREFLQEAYTSAELDHPNIVPVHELGRSADGATPLLVMKMVRGEVWADLLERERRAPDYQPDRYLARHLRILTDVCNAVAYAHSKGIIHRDLKPHQVMVGRFGEVFLMDWGLAISTAERAPIIRHRGIPKYHTLRTASNRCGSPAYMAPEQTDESTARLGPATDLYLLGAILFEIIAGQPPHGADTARAAYFMAVMNDIHPLPEETPAELRELVAWCLATRPADRPQGAEQLRDAIEDFLTGSGRRRESDEIVAEVSELLASAGAELHDYHRLALLEQRVARALQLWPESPRARSLQVDLMVRHAGLALMGRDLRLAETLAATLPTTSPDRPRLLAGIEDARSQQCRAAHQRRVAMLASVGLAAALVAGAVRFYVEQAITARVIASQAASAENVMNYMLINLRRELAKVGRLELMEDVTRLAVEYYENLPERGGAGEDSLRHRSVALWNLGWVLNERGDLARAGEFYAQAAALLDELLARSPEDPTFLGDRANVDSLRGDLAARLGDLDGAEACYRRSRDVRARLVALRPDSHVALHNMAVAEARFAVIARERGDLAEAMRRSEQAMTWRRRLAAADPETPEWRRLLSRGHQDIGDIHHERGDLAAARAEFEAAVDLLRGLVAAQPDHAGWRLDLAKALDRLGIVLVKQGDDTRAMSCYREGMALREALAAADPDNSSYRASLAFGHFNIGTAHQRAGRRAEALAHFERSLELRRTVAAVDADNLVAAEELATGERAVGVALGDLGRLEEAGEHLARAVATAERLVEAEPARYGARDALASALGEAGLVARRAGHAEQALTLLGRAVALREEMVARDPSNGQWAYELARAEQWLAQAELAAATTSSGGTGLERYRRSVERLAGLVADKPSHTTWRLGEIAARVRLAELEADAGDEARAEEQARQAALLAVALRTEAGEVDAVLEAEVRVGLVRARLAGARGDAGSVRPLLGVLVGRLEARAAEGGLPPRLAHLLGRALRLTGREAEAATVLEAAGLSAEDEGPGLGE